MKALIDNTGGDRPHLWLTKDNLGIDFERLLYVLKRKRSLKEISIYNVFSDFSNAETRRLYNAIAVKANLESFSLWSFDGISVVMITNFLKRARNVRSIRLRNVVIWNEQEAKQLGHVIRHHPSLQKLSLDNLQTNQGLFEVTLESVKKSSLRSLRVSAAPNSQHVYLPRALFTELCTSSKLEDLHLWGFKLNDDSVMRMTRSLETAGPKHPLKSLSLRYCGPDFTTQGTSALLEMVKTNFHLQHLHLDPHLSASVEDDMSFYLQLNRSGARRRLLKNGDNVSKNDWMKTLADHSNDMETLHYLLQEGGSTLWSH